MNKGVVIDAGHGGHDSGALTKGIVEKDLVLKISKYQFNRFKELGVPVALTRNADITLSSSKRTQLVKNAGYTHCISNHINAGGGDGAETIYSIYSKGDLAKDILSSLKEAGQNIRKAYTKTLKDNPSKDYYFMHRETGAVETVIVEYGFLDSNGDDISQLSNDWEKFAEAVVKAVCKNLGFPYSKITGQHQSANVFRVVVGTFTNEANANKSLVEAKKYFKDAFILKG